METHICTVASVTLAAVWSNTCSQVHRIEDGQGQGQGHAS